MSKRGGSDIQRLRNWISRSTQNQLKMAGSLVRVVQCRIRLFPTLISKIKRFGLNNPLVLNYRRIRMTRNLISNYENSFGKGIVGTTWIQTSLDRPNFCDIIICWHAITFEENCILRKKFYMCEEFWDEKWDFNFEFIFYAEKILFRKDMGLSDIQSDNFENNRCFRLKKNVTKITGIRYIVWNKFSIQSEAKIQWRYFRSHGDEN